MLIITKQLIYYYLKVFFFSLGFAFVISCLLFYIAGFFAPPTPVPHVYWGDDPRVGFYTSLYLVLLFFFPFLTLLLMIGYLAKVKKIDKQVAGIFLFLTILGVAAIYSILFI